MTADDRRLIEAFLEMMAAEAGAARNTLLAYERDSGKHVAATGPLIGRANIKYYKFLGIITFNKTTIPERKKLTKEARKKT